MTVLVLFSVLSLITLFSGFSSDKKTSIWLGIAGIAVVLGFNCMGWNLNRDAYNMIVADNFSIAFTGVIGISAILILMLLPDFTEKIEVPFAEITSLLLFTLFGAYLMLSYSNLVMLFIGIEILSISLYVLAGSKKSSLASNEAAIKYFLMGSFATGFLLFGITLIYGATGSFQLETIKIFVEQSSQVSSLLMAGVFLMLVGLAFKISAAPFHFWTPDVYQGSPSIVTAFMATVVKTAGIAAFFKLFYTCFSPLVGSWSTTIWVLAALTITIGNVTAVYQTSVKRLLAYSSIAHAGYLLIALLALNNLSSTAVLYYAIAYS
jgi:NADH-quinone oxidoreductase subunit N